MNVERKLPQNAEELSHVRMSHAKHEMGADRVRATVVLYLVSYLTNPFLIFVYSRSRSQIKENTSRTAISMGRSSRREVSTWNEGRSAALRHGSYSSGMDE